MSKKTTKTKATSKPKTEKKTSRPLTDEELNKVTGGTLGTPVTSTQPKVIRIDS